MIRIGDFARIAGTSIAALRLYDEQGLLTPIHVDPATGYRSYEASQLVELHRIQLLKDLGFTLREIRASSGVTSAQMAELLAEKRTVAERQLQVERQKMKRLKLQIQI